MAGLALHHDVERVGRRQAGPRVIAEAAHRHVRAVVEAERHVDALERALRRSSPSPPPIASSAGWNTSRTVPASCGASSFSTAATPSSVVVWMSWPQACIRPGLVLAKARPVCSSIGSASMSARIASTGPGRPPWIMPTTPVLRDAGLVLDAEPGEFARHHAGGAHLLERQFGMGVDVAADRDQPGLDPVGELGDGGGGIVGEAHLVSLSAATIIAGPVHVDNPGGRTY